MSNSNYNLELEAKASLGKSVTVKFDPYNDCTDMDGLKELLATEWQETHSEEMPEDVEIKIIDFAEVPDKWANEEDVWEFAEAFAECDQEIEVVEAALECGVSPHIDDAYNGQWKDDEEFVKYLLESTGDLPQNLPSYIHIDWERTSRDIMMDYSKHNGYYFRSL